MDVNDIARVCHEANRALQMIAGDPSPSPAWEDAPVWQRKASVDSVRSIQAGATPESLHESWRALRLAEGWVYGEVKDPEKKTHPCLVPYEELPQDQQLKDRVFCVIVVVLS
jgi:RyR domain-containing protein